jgi:hypothetical protein
MVQATLLGDRGGGGGRGSADDGERRWRERQLKALRERSDDKTVPEVCFQSEN